MAADVKVTQRCRLDSQDCVSLSDILKSFNAPINEEHAWALYYQCAKCIKNGIESDRTKCFVVSELDHILLHKDGHVHPNTVFAGGGAEGGSDCLRVSLSSATDLIFNLGLVVFRALDYGLDVEEERHLSSDLDRLIHTMTEADETPKHQHEDDEGIERDSEDEDPTLYRALLDKVIQHCTSHLGAKATPQHADNHYRAVCKALVVEALELSSFLQKISTRGGASDLRSKTHTECADLDKLQISEWSRLWLQVIQELRHGVNLKKVDFSRTPIEFTLTPYEILMDDIRSRRYKLNKVMVDGTIPTRVKKDAHAVILEFIRSRPPLRKASERKLAPLRFHNFSPRELLMDSIKKGRRLRPALSPQRNPLKKRLVPHNDLSSTTHEESPDVTDVSTKPSRRLIKVDFSKLQIDDDDDDDDDMDDDDDDDDDDLPAIGPSSTGATQNGTSNHTPAGKGGGNPWQRTGRPLGLTKHEYHSYMDLALETYDLATQCPSRRASMRRHTIVVSNGMCDAGSKSVPHSRPHSRGPTPLSSASSETDSGNLGCTLPEMSWSRSSLQDELFQSKNWQQAMECLSLTLEEIVHIRSVLTKAELEGLPVEGHVKEDVEKRKVCFLCLKTRFGIFGPWGQLCKLCKRTVCVKCYSKMRIPTEHFSRVPVFALSPGLSSPEDDAKESFPRSLMTRLMVPSGARNSVGSAPSSPQLLRGESISAPGSRLGMMGPGMADSMEGPQSLPALSPESTTSDRRGRLGRSKTLVQPEVKSKENLKGLQMNVCHDCKTMVIQIIKSSRTNRTNAIRNLTLNLSPVY